MPPTAAATPPPPTDALAHLLTLSRQARHATERAELGFLAVNDTHALAPYRQAALWFADGGVAALSGLVQPDANVPFVQWLQRACSTLAGATDGARAVQAGDLAPPEAATWAEWLPAHALHVPLTGGNGALLLARDTPWQPTEIALVSEWMDIWSHAWDAMAPLQRGATRRPARTARPRWRQRKPVWAGAALLALAVPVRLSVLAPGELVPTDPAAINAPLEGVVARFAVQPNEAVKAGQLLFSLDDATLQGRLDVARQALATAEAEYRQSAQLAVLDAKYKAQLSVLTGRIEERRAEAEYLQGQLVRSRVVAPRDGIALFDDPSEWMGKPVVTGERIMRIAAPGDVEVEAWVDVGDAIPLPERASAQLYLNASPLAPVAAQVRYAAFEAVQRPDGRYAYRVRARLDGRTDQRVGLKGTVKLSGGWVPLSYWMLRRPLAAARQFAGL